jgi:hypothetical protein
MHGHKKGICAKLYAYLVYEFFTGQKLYGNSRPEYPGPFGRHQIEYYSEQNQFAHIGLVVDCKCVFKLFVSCLGNGQVCPKHPEAVEVYEKGEFSIILYLRILIIYSYLLCEL